VVGHEIGHVTARHTAHEMSRQELAQVGLAVGSLASPTVAQYAGLASQAMSLVFLKFSRDDESQADHLGLRYMSKTGFDERQMPQVFVMLGKVSAASGGSQLPQWLETHPDPENRQQAIEREIAQLPANTAGGTVNGPEFMRRVDNLVYGADPRDGYFRGTQFLHPGMRFRMDFPQGWKTANTAQAVQGVSANQDAAIELTLAQERSAAAAAQTFSSQQGLQAGTAQRTTVNGLTAVVVPFAAATSNGNLRGNALFVEYNGTVFNLFGYAPEARWSATEGAVDAALKTFGPLNDPSALSVQPQRLDVFTAPGRTTIAELARSHPSPLQPDMLALINQVDPNSPIEAGHLVKWVTGPSLEQANRTP
jgi:predicted Zn-dependent protease